MTEPTPSRRPRRRLATVALALVALLLAAAGLWYWRVHSFHLREVLAGEIYRASQPSGEAIARAVSSKGIRTIVNLRGPNPKHEWFREERDAASKLGLGMVSLRFETFDWPPRVETLVLVQALDRAPRPILLHCHSGLDRSGWAAGVVHLLQGESLQTARSELSRLKGHLCNRDTCALHGFFNLYEEWLASARREHAPEVFREWLKTSYYPPPYAARLTATGEFPGMAEPGTRISLAVEVENISGISWTAPADRERGIRLGARILGPFDAHPADAVELFRQPRTPARDLFRDGRSTGEWSPGVSKVIEVEFDAPAEPGLYYIQIDMVDEFVHWFSDLGDVGLVVPLRVGPAAAELRTEN
ncbi:MAG: fused DSP-PTPase phosphatase/NAD kinase-like protein [Thermoanaerobaculia bacterium]